MLNKKLTKLLSTAFVFAVLATFAAFGFFAEKAFPENTIGTPQEFLEPDVIFGSSGKNVLPEKAEQTGDSEDEPETSTDPNDKPEQTSQGIPEITKEETSENEKPDQEKVTETPGGEISGEGNGDFGNEEAPEGDPTVVTDLDNMIITSGELSGDMFSFFAYIENGTDNHSLSINFRNDETSFSGEYLEESDDYYETKLSIGANYFTIYLEENGSPVSDVQYIVTYQAEKADSSNPNVGEGISITTNLDNFNEVLKNASFTFTVAAESSATGTIFSDHIEVTLDGMIVDDPTGSSVFEYVLNFGTEGRYLVAVTAWDDEGNSAYRDYVVEFGGGATGDYIGTATVVIDATTAGLGIIGEAEVEICQGDTAAKTLLDAAGMMGLNIHYDGTPDGGTSFYVRGVSGFAGVPEVPEDLWEYILRDELSLTGSPSGSVLSAADFTANSGWMYSINGTLFPGKGLSAYNLSDGDVLYLRFTVAEGKDIGGSGGGNGNLASYCGIWSDGGFYELDHEYEVIGSENGYTEYECAVCKKHYTEETGEYEHEEVYREEQTETEEDFEEEDGEEP